MYFVVFDLEATCWEGHRGPREVIEIGAVLLDASGHLLSEFETFVRPVVVPELSDFCKQLTSIRQDQVDRAPHFLRAVQAFREWIGVGLRDYTLCSWGYYDHDQLRHDCKVHGVDPEWIGHHLSLKHRYAEICGLEEPVSFRKALKREGMDFIGTPHRGIDDARNTARIFQRYTGRWTD